MSKLIELGKELAGQGNMINNMMADYLDLQQRINELRALPPEQELDTSKWEMQIRDDRGIEIVTSVAPLPAGQAINSYLEAAARRFEQLESAWVEAQRITMAAVEHCNKARAAAQPPADPVPPPQQPPVQNQI